MKTINDFMLDLTARVIECYIEENGYNEWMIEVVENGLKIINKITKQNATWNIYNYDCDFKVIRNKIEKILKLQHNH